MDITNLCVDPDGQKEVLTIIDPRDNEPLSDEEGNEVKITVWGPDSTKVKQAVKEYRNKARKKKKDADIYDVAHDILFEKAVASVDDWKNIGYKGEELECNEKNVRLIFEKAPWICEQVQSFISDRVNFMNG